MKFALSPTTLAIQTPFRLFTINSTCKRYLQFQISSVIILRAKVLRQLSLLWMCKAVLVEVGWVTWVFDVSFLAPPCSLALLNYILLNTTLISRLLFLFFFSHISAWFLLKCRTTITTSTYAVQLSRSVRAKLVHQRCLTVYLPLWALIRDSVVCYALLLWNSPGFFVYIFQRRS